VPRPHWITVLTWLVLVPGLAWSWFAWVAGCDLREGERLAWWDVCDSGWIVLPWISAGWIAAVIAAWAHYRRTHRIWPFIVAVVIAVGVGTPAWIVHGDPAGNFDGLRTD
jgi:hypothetical protein